MSLHTVVFYLLLLYSCLLYIYNIYVYMSIYIYQNSETNVMHFLFSLLRIKGPYMFRALLAHPQDKRHLVYCVRVLSAAPGLNLHFSPGAAN
jgi:hypothetical protein